MKLKKKLLLCLAVVVAVAFISGASILAVSSLGSKDDPLVTLSYLTGQFKPQVLGEVNTRIDAAKASLAPALDEKIDGFKADINAKVNSGAGKKAAVFTLVTLSKTRLFPAISGRSCSCASAPPRQTANRLP
jgi:hypothetical protein